MSNSLTLNDEKMVSTSHFSNRKKWAHICSISINKFELKNERIHFSNLMIILKMYTSPENCSFRGKINCRPLYTREKKNRKWKLTVCVYMENNFRSSHEKWMTHETFIEGDLLFLNILREIDFDMNLFL